MSHTFSLQGGESDLLGCSSAPRRHTRVFLRSQIAAFAILTIAAMVSSRTEAACHHVDPKTGGACITDEGKKTEDLGDGDVLYILTLNNACNFNIDIILGAGQPTVLPGSHDFKCSKRYDCPQGFNGYREWCPGEDSKSKPLDSRVSPQFKPNDLQRRLEKQKPKSENAQAANKQEEDRLQGIQQDYNERQQRKENARKGQEAERAAQEARKGKEAEQAAEAAKERQRQLDQERAQRDADRAARTVCFRGTMSCYQACGSFVGEIREYAYCNSSCDAPNVNSFHCFEAASARQRLEICRRHHGDMQGCDR
jgi:hypothetical protein